MIGFERGHLFIYLQTFDLDFVLVFASIKYFRMYLLNAVLDLNAVR